MSAPPVRSFMFTIHVDSWEPLPVELQQSHKYWSPASVDFASKGDIRYLVCQKEVCPTSGRRHFQGYCELKDPKRYPAIKRLLECDWAHLEKRRGTNEQAREYCIKSESRADPDGVPFEYGEFKVTQGFRSDIAAAVEELKSGKTIGDIIDNHADVVVKYSRGLTLVQEHVQAAASRIIRSDLKVFVLTGPPGVGKTRYVYDQHGLESVYTLTQSSADRVWWNGYTTQPVLLIDDFYGWIKWGEFLKVLDIYPLRLEVKGGFVYAAYKTVYITSNRSWWEWFAKSHSPDQQGALMRRIHFVHVYGPTTTQSASAGQPNFSVMSAEDALASGVTPYAPGFTPV